MQGVLCALCVLVSLPVWSQSEFCLEGTVWDATLGGCIPAESCEVEGDFNGDGVVGSADLLAFLTLYGNQYLDSDGDGLCDTPDDCNGVVDVVASAMGQVRFTIVGVKSAGQGLSSAAINGVSGLRLCDGAHWGAMLVCRKPAQ